MLLSTLKYLLVVLLSLLGGAVTLPPSTFFLVYLIEQVVHTGVLDSMYLALHASFYLIFVGAFLGLTTCLTSLAEAEQRYKTAACVSSYSGVLLLIAYLFALVVLLRERHKTDSISVVLIVAHSYLSIALIWVMYLLAWGFLLRQKAAKQMTAS